MSEKVKHPAVVKENDSRRMAMRLHSPGPYTIIDTQEVLRHEDRIVAIIQPPDQLAANRKAPILAERMCRERIGERGRRRRKKGWGKRTRWALSAKSVACLESKRQTSKIQLLTIWYRRGSTK